MKKVNFIKIFIVLLLPILLIGCGTNNSLVENSGILEEVLPIPLGNTGITVEIPSEYGFEAKKSEKNDFYGLSSSEEWAIIVNHDDKDGYTLEEYAQAVAISNNAGKAKIASDGNYYFEYKNGEYHFYTAIRQNDKYYYRVAFYCFEEDWSKYESIFADWSTTIRLEQNIEE